MLSCSGLKKSFGGLAVVRDFSIDVAAGERHAIIGPNGAGKTTVFNLINGGLRADAGKIRLGNNDLTHMAPERRARLGLSRSFQRNSCFADMTVAENLAVAVVLSWRLEWRVNGAIRRFPAVYERVEAVAKLVGILEWLEVPAGALSYGTQRQLELGIALAGQPRVLLLDEPTAGMSPAEARLIQSLIEALPRSLSIVIIEHDMDLVFGLADRVTVLDAGAVLMRGTPQEVRSSKSVQMRYLGEEPA